MYEHNRTKYYSQQRNLFLKDDIIKCMYLINKIKEHRHNKINHCPHRKLNLTTAEHKDIKELREDQSRVVLTADKGVVMVVMQKQDYTDKALTLLTNTSIYRIINKELTTRLKSKFINTLRDIKQTGGLSGLTYRKGHPTRLVPQSFMASLKYIKLVPPKTHHAQ